MAINEPVTGLDGPSDSPVRRSDKRLLASIHDVSPKFEGAVDRLADMIARHTGQARFAMLVVPDHWGNAPLAESVAFGRKLRSWAALGAEMFVHGWYHLDQSRHGSTLASLKAKHMTQGEGEFLGLDRRTALSRMRDGRALVEDVIGGPVAGFIAPAWLYGEGALQALAEAEFAIAEDHLSVWSPASATVLARGPVITWASRSRSRTASSLIFAALARHILAPMKTIRLAVHPGDTRVPEILASIDCTLAAISSSRNAGRYADLLAD